MAIMLTSAVVALLMMHIIAVSGFYKSSPIANIATSSAYYKHSTNNVNIFVSLASTNDDWSYDDSTDFSDNIPASKRKLKIIKSTKDSSSSSSNSNDVAAKAVPAASTTSKNTVVPNANLDWRSVRTTINEKGIETKSAASSPTNWRPESKDDANDYEYDLDYDDFEAAMDEEDGGYTLDSASARSSKGSELPRENLVGLKPGSIINSDLWNSLLDSNGDTFKYVKLHKEFSNIGIILCDPRRMNDQFKTILTELNKIPLIQFDKNLVVAAVNCDDFNDHRKFIKKNIEIKMPMLSDPKRNVSATQIINNHYDCYSIA